MEDEVDNRSVVIEDEVDGTNIIRAGEAWINEVRKSINLARPMDHAPCTILKVPEHIRQLDPTAYEPGVAFLGPLHHEQGGRTFSKYHPFGKFHRHEWRFVRHLLSRHGSPEHASQLLDKCLSELKKQDGMVRSCYSEEFPELNAQEMALIMLLDGCFIIHLMLNWYKKGMKQKTKEEEKESSNEEIKGEEIELEKVEKLEDEGTEEKEGKKRGEHMIEIRDGEVVLNIEEKDKELELPDVIGKATDPIVAEDLLKLENQIPFFIIQLLFDHLKNCEDGKINLVDISLQLFDDIYPGKSKSFEKKPLQEYHHLLHLFYSSRIPSKRPAGSAGSTSARGRTYGAIEHRKSKWKKEGARTSAPPKWIPSATELNRAGVKFKRNERADSFLSITFRQRSGRMEIPTLYIFGNTGRLFRNLIAFEQCYSDTKRHITVYAMFMDCTIDRAEDVRLLHLEGILEHGAGNDHAVAALFNELARQTFINIRKIYLADEIEKVNEFYDVKWHKWLAALRRDYLGSPWASISVLAAIVLLLLTIERATFSALSYFQSS